MTSTDGFLSHLVLGTSVRTPHLVKIGQKYQVGTLYADLSTCILLTALQNIL